jgi:long-chain acyl-CoA synthetase
VQAVLGGNIVLIGCGAAPITPEVVDFLRVAFAADVIEGAFHYWVVRRDMLT